MANSTKRGKLAKPGKTKSVKPKKPYPDFPLFPHATRRWAKKILGKLHYFGPWADPQAALDKYLDQKDDLHAGRIPRPRAGDGLTVADLCNRFLTAKRHLLDTREIVERSFRDYLSTCERLAKEFGKTRLIDDLTSADFAHLHKAITKTRGHVATGNEVSRVRSVFKYAFDEGLIAQPIRYGQGFKKPSAKTLRIARAANGKRMFEADELRTIIDAATMPLRAIILLGINCGFGQSDISALPLETVTKAIETGWLDYPRPKTGVPRRCPLWPATRDALHEVIDSRPKPKDTADAALCFITKYGKRWVKPDGDDAVAKEFTKLLKALELKRPRVGFYAIRHTFETIGGGSRDQVAVNSLMGHVDSTMSGLYREDIEDTRLTAVTKHVHKWLYSE